MTQALIRKTFTEAIVAYAAAQSPALPVARENMAFTKPTTGNFLEVFLLPADTRSPNVAADTRRFLGSFQVNIWTRENAGTEASETIAEAISQLFPMVPNVYSPVIIEAPVSIKRPISDVSGWRITPLLISYRMEADN
jgi:hypothetical protein